MPNCRLGLPSALCAVLVAAPLLAGPAAAGTFAEVTGFGSNPGALKMFTYLPDAPRDPAPLVVVMHGCNQNAADYLAQSGWREAADDGGFVVVLPEQQSINHPTRCLNFAERLESIRDSGEALSIRQMVAHAAASLAIDPDRVFVTGLSAGGGMTAVMLATYPDVFAAGAIVAGLPYRCGDATFTAPAACGVTLPFQGRNPAPDRTAADWGGRVRAAAPAGFAGPWPRVSIWQGEADGTVDPPNATELVEQWTNVHGVDAVADAEETVGPATRAAFAGADGGTRVELYTIPGFGHATPIDPDAPGAPCGRAGEFIRDADICSTTAIAGFFGLVGEPPAVTIDAATVDGDAIEVAGTATDPDGPIAEVSVRLDGAAPQPAQTADGTATWSVRFAAPPPDRFYLPVAVATDADGETATARGAPVALGTPPPNAPPVVAIDTVRVEGACVAVDGRATDDLGPVVEVAVTLGARAPGEAALDGGNFTFQDCGLPDGVHAVEVTAIDALGARATVSAPPVTVAARITASGAWLDHLREGRLRLYAAPCPSVGFGTCDAAFAAIHAEHGFAAFDLFRAAASEDWFIDPSAIP